MYVINIKVFSIINLANHNIIYVIHYIWNIFIILARLLLETPVGDNASGIQMELTIFYT